MANCAAGTAGTFSCAGTERPTCWRPIRCLRVGELTSSRSICSEPLMISPTRLALAVVLVMQLCMGVLYATRTPRWQAPDEPAHFNYVRALAETGTFPVLRQGDYDQAYLERLKSEKFPPELSIDIVRYESHQPPLYYLLAAPVYLLA